MSVFTDAARPKGNFIKFNNKGDFVQMEVIDYTTRQATNYDTKQPEFFPSGDPRMEQLITGMDYNAESEEEARCVVVVNKRLMRQRIGEALEAAEASDVQPGGILTITYIGDGVATRAGARPPKDFEVSYELPEPAESPWGGE